MRWNLTWPPKAEMLLQLADKDLKGKAFRCSPPLWCVIDDTSATHLVGAAQPAHAAAALPASTR